MSVPHLPDDLNQWPADAYQVLAVGADVTPLELRRAYTRLIRHFKPETFPDHFRRLREAYEQIQAFLQFFPEIAAQPPVETLHAPTPVQAPMPVPREWDPEDQKNADGDLGQELIALWEQACAGSHQAAYDRLRQLYLRHGAREDILLRLYWLLHVAPEVDPIRRPADWLLEGLLAQGGMGTFRELYRRVVEQDPREAVSTRYDKFLALPQPTVLLAQAVSWRWFALAATANWNQLGDDLERLAPRFVADEENWARLLLLAIDHLAWERAPRLRPIVQGCLNEVERLKHVHERLQNEMFRLDVLMDLAPACHDLSKQESLAGLVDLVRLSWTRPAATLRLEILRFADQLARQPFRSLDTLDMLQAQFPMVLGQLSRCLQEMEAVQGQKNLERGPEALAKAAGRFLQGAFTENYARFRGRLLSYCLEDNVTAGRVVDALLQQPAGQPWSQMLQHALNDWPLQCVTLAHGLMRR